jgi:hypothetical protein
MLKRQQILFESFIDFQLEFVFKYLFHNTNYLNSIGTAVLLTQN